MLKSGDGYTMFKDNKILKDEVLIDNQVLINYIVDVLGGSVAWSVDPLRAQEIIIKIPRKVSGFAGDVCV